MKGSCHCGRVTVTVPGRPDYLNVCNCSLCTKLGGLWAYYPQSRVTVTGETRGYVRSDLSETFLATHSCGTCGALTHWSPLRSDMPDRMGVNMRLFEPAEVEGVEVRYGNRRDERPGAPTYYRAPTIFHAEETPA